MADEQSVRPPKNAGFAPRPAEREPATGAAGRAAQVSGSAAAFRVGLGDGCFLSCRFDGPEGAPVLMLSNSLGTHMEMWAAQLATFARHFRVLRYDSRGHGASDAPTGAYSMDRLGRDVVELLDALELERVHFCGLSKGGMVGQWLAARAPERIDHLVLANTAAYMGPPSGWQERIDTVMRDGMAAVADSVVQRWFTPEFVASSPAVVAAVRGMLLATPRQGYAGCCAAIRDMDLRPTAPLVACPTLIVSGTRDPSTPPAKAEELAHAVGTRPEVAMLDAAHLSNVERPNEFARAVLDFLPR